MAVLDASVVVAVLTQVDGLLGAGARAAIADGATAPSLVDAEVGHVLRRRVRGGLMTSSAGAAAILDLERLPIVRTPHEMLLERAWELRENLSFYDALYVALAERLHLPLLTFDERIAGAPGMRCEVEVL